MCLDICFLDDPYVPVVHPVHYPPAYVSVQTYPQTLIYEAPVRPRETYRMPVVHRQPVVVGNGTVPRPHTPVNQVSPGLGGRVVNRPVYPRGQGSPIVPRGQGGPIVPRR